MRKGFTLVELAIVLVIIGLLIGGVLVAQSMINTAKIQKAVRLLAQCDVAINNFRSKYQQLPGDSSYFTPAGDNNGDVDYAETTDAWVHLSQAEMFKNSAGTDYQTLGGWTGAMGRTNLNCPDFDLPSDGSVVGKRCLFLRYWAWLAPNPWIWIETGNMGTGVGGGAALRPRDALAIDKKIDDGIGNTGGYQSAWNTFLCTDGAGVYAVGNTNFTCSSYTFVGTASGLKN